MRRLSSRCMKHWEKENRIDGNILLLEISNSITKMSKNLERENKLFPKKGKNFHCAESRQKTEPVF